MLSYHVGELAQDANTGASGVTCVWSMLEGGVDLCATRFDFKKEITHAHTHTHESTQTNPRHAIQWARCQVSLYVAVEQNGENIKHNFA